jgi:lipoprotein LprG
MTRARKARLGTFGVTAALLLAACSDDPAPPSPTPTTLPRAETLLTDAAEEMRDLTSARFVLESTGEIAGLEVRRAEGVLTNEGEVQATVDLEEGGQLIEFEIVVAQDELYVKGPTGGFRKIPSFLRGTFYDPSILLDPQKGIGTLVASARDGRTVAAEEAGGRATFRVEATLDGEDVARLVPIGIEEDTPGTLWIGQEEPLLVQAFVELPAEEDREGTRVTVTLTEFDVGADIQPPA